MKKNKILIYIFSLTIYLIILVNFFTYTNQTVYAFFEDQLRYKLESHWYPMLSDSSPEKRFQASSFFLRYPEWSLPLLRNTMINPDYENFSWQIAMLIGMMGDSSDVPPLLKIWKELGMHEKSSIWLGAMRRLYWKSRGAAPKTPVLKSLAVNIKENFAKSENGEKEMHLLFQIENPANTPIFIIVSVNFWLTMTENKIPLRYYWIPASGFIESSIKTKIYPDYNSDKIRLDFRIWEVGVTEALLHHSREILLPVK